MILNVWTVTAFFLAVLGFLLAAAAGATSLRCLGTSDPRRLGERVHLLALIVAVLALVRGLAWPHFYLLLESYVPALAPYGVMCTFGVTRIAPGYVVALQWLKPALLLALAGWWALAWLDRASERTSFVRLRCRSMAGIALLAATECVVELLYLAAGKLGRPVTCCTEFADLETSLPSAAPSPLAGAGLGAPAAVIAAWAVAEAVVIACALLAARRAGGGAWSRTVRVALALLALANLVVTRWAWLDAIAPRVLGLPYHHCIYEVVTRAPAMGLAALLTLAGNLVLAGFALLAALLGREPGAFDRLERAARRFAAVALASALLVVLVHVL